MRALIGLLAVIAIALLSTSASAEEYSTQKGVRSLVVEIYGYGPVQYTTISGPCEVWYSPPYMDADGKMTIDTEILAMDLMDDGPRIRLNGGLPSPGTTKSVTPGIDFPAESFFDVFTEIELPDFFPMDTLINYEPLHMTSLVDQWPPYFSEYIHVGPPVVLYNKGGIAVGEIIEWIEYLTPYYPPEAHISPPLAYKSIVGLRNEAGLLEFHASLNGIDDGDIDFAEFSYRPLGEPSWTVFHTDFSGAGTDASTYNPIGEGDGWCGYFEPGSEPFEGQVAECRVEFFTPLGIFADTCEIWIDPTPPIPWINIHPDTVGLYHIDSFFDVMFEVEDELPEPGPAELQVYPLAQRFERTLTPVDQHGLGTDMDDMSCGPAAAASCLKYFADNGYPGLDNPGGDEAKPEQSGEDIARELQGPMGTNGETGTSGDGMVAGIESYLEGHGQEGWDVEGVPVESDADLAEMFREFEADSEDVMILLQDTVTAGEDAGDTIGHWVTMGSREQIQHSADSTSQKIDFMDPNGGSGTEDNNYDIGENDAGSATVEGYHVEGGSGGGSAWIAGYVKVSPPSDGGGGSGSPPGMPGAPAFDPHWIPIDAGIVRGNGLTDTLHLDTHGLMPGLHLMEVITTNHQGHTCRDLRMILLVDPTTDADPPTPDVKTGLRGTYPNPFNPSTNIEFSMANDGPVTIAIYDVSGRRIRTLVSGKKYEAGTHTVTWDGVDDQGRTASSGVYFCRFIGTGSSTSSAKMILLR